MPKKRDKRTYNDRREYLKEYRRRNRDISKEIIVLESKRDTNNPEFISEFTEDSTYIRIHTLKHKRKQLNERALIEATLIEADELNEVAEDARQWIIDTYGIMGDIDVCIINTSTNEVVVDSITFGQLANNNKLDILQRYSLLRDIHDNKETHIYDNVNDITYKVTQI